MHYKKGEDLKKRTKLLAIEIIKLVGKLPRSRTADILGQQIVKSATSAGANYRTACRARSRADFISKMGIVEGEADETLYWLEILLEVNLGPSEQIQRLHNEYNEILAIMVASIKTAKNNYD